MRRREDRKWEMDKDEEERGMIRRERRRRTGGRIRERGWTKIRREREEVERRDKGEEKGGI